jgi:DNA-directed RNA polymerase subunit M/transcription elongation factor TFIIS
LILRNAYPQQIPHTRRMNASGNVPLCPNCGRQMILVRVTPRLGGLPELRSYECLRCRVAYTERVDD